METNIPDVYAIGDVVELTEGVSPMLAYTASHEGEVAVENALGHEVEMSYEAIPSTIFTNPEVSSVGLSEKDAREKYGEEILIGKFNFQGNGRAVIAGQNRGFVKVILAPDTTILGIHIIGHHATELISGGAIAVANKLKAEDIIKIEHAHPVLYESIKEAILVALGRPIHA
jgi:dihydrolipoamide dehydrogenase